MKYIFSTLVICVLFLSSCKNATSGKDEVAAANPDYQEMKKMEATTDEAMPVLVDHQKGFREILHNLERANQVSDSLSLKIRANLSDLNKGENAFSTYKTTYSKVRLDTMPENKRVVFAAYAKQEAESARDLVLYAIQQAKKTVILLKDKGVQIEMPKTEVK